MQYEVKAPKIFPPGNSGPKVMPHFWVNIRGSCQYQRHERFRADEVVSYAHLTLLFDLSRNR